MNMDISYYTSIGGRPCNQDSVALQEQNDRLLAVVADGLGGHEAGEIASRIAVNTVLSLLSDCRVSPAALDQAVQTANRRVLEDPASDTMKTTIAVLWATRRQALLATVGDTRIYHFRNNRVLFRTIDHSVSQMSVMAGEITPDEIRGDPDRNKLVRVLGHRDRVKADILSVSLAPRDALLLCSDGFWEAIVEEQMCAVLARTPSAKAWLTGMQHIVNAASTRHHDNHSAIAIIVE